MDRYAAVAADGEIGLEDGMEACDAVRDRDLRGDCLLHVATVEARRDGGRADRACEAAPPGVWQDECWFMTAEAYRRRGRDAYAAALCLKAGAFVDDCAQHLWQTQVHDLVYKRRQPGFLAIMEPAQRIYAHWSPYLAQDTDFEQRFWAKVYQNGFEALGTAALDWCRELGPAWGSVQVERCEAACVEFYARELGPRLDRAGLSVCAFADPTTTSFAQWFPVEPDPRFDAAIRARRTRECPTAP